MNDPHVVELRYRVEAGPGLTFVNPPSVENENATFRMILKDGVAIFHLKGHFPSAESAKKVIDEYVRAWEIQTGLEHGSEEIRFIFEDANMVDLNPPQPGSTQTIGLKGIESTSAFGSVVMIRRDRFEYPAPPKSFRATPEVKALWERYVRCCQGKEPFPGFANLCLTAIETMRGGRTNAAQSLRISRNVLDNLGKLAASGDMTTARKVEPDRPLTPLTREETAWIKAAIRIIIHRLGESDTNLPFITMGNLPDLNDKKSG